VFHIAKQSAFQWEMHQNDFFLFLTSIHQNNRKTLKNTNLMPFQSKHTFKKHSKAEATALPNKV
jgi:hypothetical protein